LQDIVNIERKPIESHGTKPVVAITLVGLVIGLLCWLLMVFVLFLLSSNPTPSILIAVIGASITMIGGMLAGIVGVSIRPSRAILRGAVSGMIAGSFLTVATYLMMADIEATIFLFFYGALLLGIWVFRLISVIVLVMVGAIAGLIAGAVGATGRNFLGCMSGGVLPSLFYGLLLLSVVWIGRLNVGFPFGWIIVVSLVGATSGAILGGLFGVLGGAISKPYDNQVLGNAIGTAFGGTFGALITVIFLIPFFVGYH
jgi:hypothetical protein